MLKFNRVLLGACCFVFPVLFYSASQLKQSCPVEEVQWDAGTSWEEYEGHLAWSMRTPPQDKSSKLEQTANDTRVKASSKPTQSAKSKRPNLGSKAKQLAYETAIKLQYALDSTDANFEDPHLFTMGQYMNSLTIYLKLMLSNESVDQEPFHNLRQRLFPWWFPSSYAAYLPWDPHDRPETGIVVTVGNGNFVLAAHLIRTLRNVVNSSLPIEIYYAGDSDLPEDKREEIKALGPSLVTINIHDQFNESIAGIQNSGFAMKPFAALASSFERVILVDADTIFLQRPDGYFNEHAGLRETGLYYFHDRTIQIRTTTDWVKTLMHGREPSTTLSESIYWQQELDHQQESGVVFYNKAIPSAFISLLFTTYMNTLKVRSEVYQHVWGDKETYWLASELCSAPYTFAPNYASIIGNLPTDPATTAANQSMEMCSAQPLHLHHNGLPFWFNSGLRLEKMVDSRQYVNLTHYLPGGSSTTANAQLTWRFLSQHTFCTNAEAEKWKSLERVGLKGVADALLEEAKRVDMILLGHEGGTNPENI